MSETTKLSDLPKLGDSVERDATCGCGSAFRQRGFQSASRVIGWSPTKCADCERKAREELSEARDLRKQLAAERRQIEEQEATEARKQEALEMLAIPPLYEDATLDTWAFHGSVKDRDLQGKVIHLARRFVGTWPTVDPITLLRGGPGTGKGHWAYGVARILAGEFGVRTRVAKLADMVRRLRASWGRRTEDSEEQTLDLYRWPDLLVIDEMSRHAFYGQQIHQHLYDVLDHRIEHRRPTILTTNEDNEGCAEILRAALWSRLVGNGAIIEFGNADYRVLRVTG